MKRILISILFRLLKIPITTKFTDISMKKDWLGLQYPTQGFHNYILSRNLYILQILGEGVSREDYLIALGQRIEIGRLLTEAKKEFAIAEKKRKDKK